MHLKHLSISGFRGIGSHLDFPLTHRTIIYGPNGSGKSSVLQAITWTIYGKIPFLTGGVFFREDALVNDFLDEDRAAVTLTLSDDVTVTRMRNKQKSTSRGKNPLTIPFETDDPQAAVEQMVGLSLEEFFAAVFLHQETIRDFIITTPEKRSATIDRMLGTHLLRALVKVVDPKVPAKAIEETERTIEQLDRQLSQASVISREMILKRKEAYGDPAELPQLLERIRQDLVPVIEKLGLPAPEAALPGLEGSLAAARQGQLETVSKLEGRAGQLDTLKERYEQVAVTSWQTICQRREEHGDPADLSNLLGEIRQDLIPIVKELELAAPQATIAELEESLAAARRAQPSVIGQLAKKIEQLGTLKERYEQTAVTSWQTVHQRREEHGDPADLPNLLGEIQQDLMPVTEHLELATPRATIAEIEKSLADARRVQPSIIGQLVEKQVGQLGTLKERYEHTSRGVIEDVSIPAELETRQAQIQTRIDTLNREEIPTLTRQLSKRQATKQELEELRRQVQILPDLRDEIEQMQRELEDLEVAGKQGTLYKQILTVGQEYLEQTLPEHCPLCKEKISDLQALLKTLRQETPEDIEKMRQEYKTLGASFNQKRGRVTQLEQKQGQIQELEILLTEIPEDLEFQLKDKRQENDDLTSKLSEVQAEITRIEGRIKLAAERRRRLDVTLKEVEKALGQPPGEDVVGTLNLAIQATREQAAQIQALDFQPIAAKLNQAKQLSQIEKDEDQLRQRLDTVLKEVREALGQPPDEDVIGALDQTIQATRERAAQIQALDFRPVAAKLDQANQLSQIEKDEAQLRQRLDTVLEEVKEALGQPLGEDVAGTLDQAIQATRERAAEIQALDFQPVAEELNRAKQLNEIREDESYSRELESSYQTAVQEKARLNYQIQRLTGLRNALQDIAETTKRHQQTIVTGVLNALDIRRYYQQLDPHPAYRQLQIEPELTTKGTYSYWIKALTDDRSHGTYVQTRFSTAQANCAAIAIFLAVNQHLSKQLETIILDDPSQSMDPEHKRRLAQTLAIIPRQVIVATEDPQMFELLVDAFETPTIHQLDLWTVDGASLVG